MNSTPSPFNLHLMNSVVSIISTMNATIVRNELWIGVAVDAMTTFFDCKAYSTSFRSPKPRLEWSFYGIDILQTSHTIHS
jgi:hypothetical protein